MGDRNLKRKTEHNDETDGENGGRKQDVQSESFKTQGTENKAKRFKEENREKKSNAQKIPTQEVIGTCLDKNELRSLEMKIHEMTKECDSEEKQIIAQQKLITELVNEKADFKRNLALEECMQNVNRLGHIDKEHRIRNHWSKGYAFDDLKRRKEEMKADRAALNRRKNQLIKSQKSILKSSTVNPSIDGSKMGNTGEGNICESYKISECAGKSDNLNANFPKSDPVPGPCTSQEFHINEKILELQDNHLKKANAALKLEKQSLERECIAQTEERFRIGLEHTLPLEEFSVLNNRYSVQKFLAKGGYGDVFKGFDLNERKIVACKMQRSSALLSTDKKARFLENALRECEMQRNLDHPHIVKVYEGFNCDRDRFCTIMEFCEGNNLEVFLKQHRTIVEKEAKIIIMQIVSALKYLSKQNPPIIHFDIKPGNIMLTEAFGATEIKITDFGVSKHYNRDDGLVVTKSVAGTLWYEAPECFAPPPQKFSTKIDVWSLGVTFFKILYGKKPFGEYQTRAEYIREKTLLNATQVGFPSKPKVSLDAKKFIKDCLTFRQEERMDVMTMAQHGYLQPPAPKPAQK